MANSSLGIRIGIPPEIAQKLREQSSDFEDPNANSSIEFISSKTLPQTDESTESLPGISIRVEKLVGYQPSDDEELELIQSQLFEAMWTRYQQTTSDVILDGNQAESPPPDFDSQVMEFFDSGLARYCEDPSYREDGRLVIRYPKYLQSPSTGERIPTLKLVQELKKEHTLDFLQKIWKYLRGCSRTLFWKRGMAAELSHLIREEQARLDYQQWTESKRQAKLDELYAIRETLLHQVVMAKSKVGILEEKRESEVKQAMGPIQRKILQKLPDSMNAFGTSELSFPDEFQWLGLRDEPLDEEDQWSKGLESAFDDDDNSWNDDDGTSMHPSDPSSADESGAEAESDVISVEGSGDAGSHVQRDISTSMALESPSYQKLDCIEKRTEPIRSNAAGISLPFKRRKKRRERALLRENEEQKASEREARTEQIRKLESELRTKLTSKELILAQTMHGALAEKMTKIEELLDSLQDEVWQAEEETEGAGASNLRTEQDDEPSFSLLDQVLAMILGATPNIDDKKPEEHYRTMQIEHRGIVQAWKAHFGRLPLPAGLAPGSSQSSRDPVLHDDHVSSKEQRKQLGIAENDNDDWEALDGILDAVSNENNVSPASNSPLESRKIEAKQHEKFAAPRLIGLRPGGKVVRPSN
jgi:hypothetical protein